MASWKAFLRNGEDQRHWYTEARATVVKLAEETGRQPSQVAEVLALTSPRISVTRNLRVARQYLLTGSFPKDTIRSTRAAVAHWEKTGEIRGPKTGAFAQVLKGQEEHLVVDTHMARAFGFHANQARNRGVIKTIRKKMQRELNTREGWTMAQLQAAVWAGYYRKTYPRGKVPTMSETLR